MIRQYEPRDLRAIHSIMRHPRVRPWLGTDLALEEFEPGGESLVYAPERGQPALAVWALDRMLTYTERYSLHTIIDPCLWGRSAELTRAAAARFFTYNQQATVHTLVHPSNVLALRLVRSVGMLEGGTFGDYRTFTITKEILCQHSPQSRLSPP